VLGTLFLAILGNALWDVALRDALLFVANFSLEVMAGISVSYADFIHHEIGKAHQDQLTVIPYLLFLAALTLGPSLLAGALWWDVNSDRAQILALAEEAGGAANDGQDKAPGDEEHDDEQLEYSNLDLRLGGMVRRASRVRAFATVVFFGSVLTAANGGLLLARDGYVRRACTYVERSIEILAPNVDEGTRLRLRAEYRMVSNAAGFYSLHERLAKLGRAHAVTLPEFDPVGWEAPPAAEPPPPSPGD
jgi:hypothetical protein